MLCEIGNLTRERPRADVCVIGSGAAGITLAMELANGGRSVIVLEGGGAEFEAQTHALYDAEVIGLAHGGITTGRARVLGGTTTRWAGQALPLLEVDFEERPWVPNSGWPFARDTLQPFYRKACALLSIPAFPPDDADLNVSAVKYDPPFDRRVIVPLTSRFSPHPNLASAFCAQLAASARITVVLHANVTEIVSEPSGRSIDYVVARSLPGHQLCVRADTFVVCAGGIESARLLLVSDRYAEGGLGNAGDLVGRCFQDHPGLAVGPIHAGDRRNLLRTFRPRRRGTVRYQPLFRLSEELQRREKLLNAGGAVLFTTESNSDPVRAGKVVARSLRYGRFGPEARAALTRIARRPRPLLVAAARYGLFRQPPIDTSRSPWLTVGGEQAPNRASRVFLADERDALGMRRLKLDWRLTTQEMRTWTRFAEVAATELDRTGLGSVELDTFRLPDDPDELSGLVVDAAHHIGTTRMATDASSGVVDAHCRVFGVENLHVASSAVFPTGGFSNPTLTIIALALRLADHLIGRELVEPRTDGG